MNTISCEVLTIENEEETHVGHLNVYFPPRVGEYIWFSEKKKGILRGLLKMLHIM